MYVQSGPLGVVGLVPDQPEQIIPVGGWTEGLNLRFNDGYVERIREPDSIISTEASQSGEWLQLYEDDNGPRVVYASEGKLYRLNLTGDAWEDVTNTTIGTYADGEWQSFQYGTSVVFNNGVNPPQILYANTAEFRDLPNWGVLTSGTVTVTCRSIRPYRDYMVAVDCTIDGVRSPNAVWSSGPALIDNVTQDSEMPSWDYESPASLSVLNYVGVEDGPLIDGKELSNNFILYTGTSGHQMQLVGGTFIFSFRRVLDYGLIGVGAVADFNNFHFCVGPSTLYIHDGSSVRQIADARVQDSFFRGLANFDGIKCEENLEFKEIHTLFNSVSGRGYLVYNYKDDNWTIGQAEVEGDECRCMSYGTRADFNNETWDSIATTWAAENRSWSQMNKGIDAVQRAMYWLTDGALHEAEVLNSSDTQKQYYIARGGLDFSSLDASMTTEKSKTLDGVIPHINGQALTQFTFSYSDNLNTASVSSDIATYDPVNNYKVDTRINGRWLGIRMDLISDGDWRLSSMDYDLEVPYDR